MKLLKLLVSTLFLSTMSYANINEYGPFSVSSLRVGQNGIYVKLTPAPSACGGGAQYRMHAKAAKTEPNYEELTSALLTAYTANQKIDYIWVRNEGVCSNTSILELYMLEFRNKT